MKIGLLNDSHFGDKNDAQYLLDFQEKFFTQFFFPKLYENNITHIFHLGDFFDRRKYINFGTLNRTKKMFLQPLQESHITMDIIPGNHDIFHKNTNDVNSLQELFAGYKNINIHEVPEVVTMEGTRFMFLPWLNGENYAPFMDWVKNNDADILLAHLELAGFPMYAGIQNQHGMDGSLFDKFKMVLSGHFHHRSSKGNIHYLGTQYELRQADAGDLKGFHIFDTETKQIEFIPNPFTLYENIVYNDETVEDQAKFVAHDVSKYENKIVRLIVLKKTKPKLFESFVERLYKQNMIGLSIIEDHSGLHEENVELDLQNTSTRELLEKYIDNSETDMSKVKLKDILNTLYVQAVNMSGTE